MATVKKFTVIKNPELEKVIKGFVPVFGSDQDLTIVTRIFDLEKKLGSVDNTVLRSGKDLTKKMKDILFAERGLIAEITNRNLDF